MLIGSRPRPGALSGIKMLAVSIALALIGAGCSGQDEPETFVQFQTIVTPERDRILNISETIDYDTGGADRNGVFREIPNDNGSVRGVTVETDGGSSEFIQVVSADQVYLRIGSPTTTFTGRRRYQVNYQVPRGGFDVGERFSIDLFGDLPFPVTRARAVLSGFELSDVACFSGELDSKEPCEIEQIEPGVYEAILDDVPVGDFFTVEGTVEAIVDAPPVAIDPVPSVASATTSTAG